MGLAHVQSLKTTKIIFIQEDKQIFGMQINSQPKTLEGKKGLQVT